jgi:hypothetical protein
MPIQPAIHQRNSAIPMRSAAVKEQASLLVCSVELDNRVDHYSDRHKAVQGEMAQAACQPRGVVDLRSVECISTISITSSQLALIY